jgi:hypothetical protein
MEKPGYRDNLERLCVVFPDKELLNKHDVAKFTGLNYRTVCKRFPFRNNYISKATLARTLS